MKRPIVVFLMALLLAACRYQAVLIADDGRQFSPVHPSQVRLTPESTTDYPYYVVGRLALNTVANAEVALQELAALAARAGADLVLDVQVNQANGRLSVTGLGVRLAPAGAQGAASASPATPPTVSVPAASTPSVPSPAASQPSSW